MVLKHIVLTKLNIDRDIQREEHRPYEFFKVAESKLDAILLNREETITEIKSREKEFNTFGKFASNEFNKEFIKVA